MEYGSCRVNEVLEAKSLGLGWLEKVDGCNWRKHCGARGLRMQGYFSGHCGREGGSVVEKGFSKKTFQLGDTDSS